MTQHFLCHKLQLSWLSFGIISTGLMMPLTAWAGSTPSGGASGVSGPPVTAEIEITTTTTTTTANATLDPVTGELLLAAGAQESLNTTARQLFLTLESTSPELTTVLSNSFFINLEQSVENAQLVSSFGSSVPPGGSLGQYANATAAAIMAWRSVNLSTSEGTLTFSHPLLITGSSSEFRSTAVYSPVDGSSPSTTILRGSPEQLGNAAACLVVMTSTGAAPEEVAPFIEMALAGVPCEQVVDLINATSGLLTAAAGGGEEDIDPTQLNQAIYAYNAIVTSVDDTTLNTLVVNPEFVSLGQMLRGLRASIDA